MSDPLTSSSAHPEPSGPAPQTEQWVWLARIRRTQGRKGEVFADILTDFPEKFADRRRLWLIADPESPQAKPGAKVSSAPLISAPLEVELIAHWLHKGGIVLHFSGIDSISAAELLAGKIVAIPHAQRAPLAEEEVYTGDLIGCALFDVAETNVSGAAPRIIGQIEDIDRAAGPVALLVVNSASSGDEILIPFAKSYLRRIDLAAKRVEMALPEGLIDLNNPQKP